MLKEQKEILVFADWKDLNSIKNFGILKIIPAKNKEIFSFEYDQDWLNNSFYSFLDPDLKLYKGNQFLNNEKPNFGIFLDSSPDRWGRLLMRRRESILARKENRKEKLLLESDYLLGVFDEYRMGGIRFKENLNSDFMNNDRKLASPPWSSLRELEYASSKVENENFIEDDEYLKWLNMLISPGSSLGGARPKASVLDKKNHLWIAKFPSNNDIKDIGAWEMVANELALNSGLNVAEGMLLKFSSKYHTFLTKRFDRTETKERIHFASAMTLLGYTDGKNHEDGISYLELVEFLIQNGANIKNDLEELWKRIVFNICIKNTDDHLRNHGFLLTNKGWVISPAYDINPIETGTGLKLNISENDNSLDLDLALDVADYFYLKKNNAKQIILDIKNKVKEWRNIANKYNISKSEQEFVSKAFENIY